jgi:hypothetical protein
MEFMIDDRRRNHAQTYLGKIVNVIRNSHITRGPIALAIVLELKYMCTVVTHTN